MPYGSIAFCAFNSALAKALEVPPVATFYPRQRFVGLQFGHLLFQLPDSVLMICRLNGTKLQSQKRRQTSRNPGVKPAGKSIRDQASPGVANGTGSIQIRQRFDILCRWAKLAPAANSAQFGGLLRVRVKETETAFGRGGPAGVAGFGSASAFRISLQFHSASPVAPRCKGKCFDVARKWRPVNRVRWHPGPPERWCRMSRVRFTKLNMNDLPEFAESVRRARKIHGRLEFFNTERRCNGQLAAIAVCNFLLFVDCASARSNRSMRVPKLIGPPSSRLRSAAYFGASTLMRTYAEPAA
jgi:hypothetical protein